MEAVIKDGHLKIPLSACHFFRGRMGNVKGTVHITVACNIGNAHMPESNSSADILDVGLKVEMKKVRPFYYAQL